MSLNTAFRARRSKIIGAVLWEIRERILKLGKELMLCSVDKNKPSMRVPHEAESTPGDNFRALYTKIRGQLHVHKRCKSNIT